MNSNLPPKARTPLGSRLSQAARDDKLELPVCGECGQVQYPPREICRNCLSADIDWKEVDNSGEVIASVDLWNSLEPWFRERLPWPIASVALAAGGVALAHIHPDARAAGTAVKLRNLSDASGEGVLYALPAEEGDVDQGVLETLLTEYGADSRP